MVVSFELFHLTSHSFSLHSQSEKQDSEMMAVRTADKLLKVNLPLCFFFCVDFGICAISFLYDISIGKVIYQVMFLNIVS